MSNKNFQTEENEILNGDDEKVRRLLGGLKRVDAPKDFDFRLKARIKSAKPDEYKPRLFPVLRYIAPLGLAIIIIAVFVAASLFSIDRNAVDVVEQPVRTPVQSVNAPLEVQPKEPIITETNSQTVNAENPPVNAVNTNKKDFVTRPKNEELAVNTGKSENNKLPAENKGGSRLEAQKEATTRMPRGIGTNEPVSVKGFLSTLGIEVNLSGKQWKVTSVGENSNAGKAGVKVDDIITAIDGNDLSGEMLPVNKPINGKLIVVRGGEKLEITLQYK